MSMQLTNTNKVTFDDTSNNDNSNTNDSKPTRSQSIGNKKTITSKYFRINAQKDNLYKLRRERNYRNLVLINKERQESSQDVE